MFIPTLSTTHITKHIFIFNNGSSLSPLATGLCQFRSCPKHRHHCQCANYGHRFWCDHQPNGRRFRTHHRQPDGNQYAFIHCLPKTIHPELTGRENIYLNGAILGMKKSEIARQFDAIVDFSGTEQFLDTPVKRYSSGMYVRLAFAVAAHLNPEILIVDEVLAVGDAEFQKKCLGKMKEVSEGGRTVIFVSHNIQAVRTLCSRAIYLRGGRVAADRDVEAGVKDYLSFNNMTLSSQRVWDDPADRPGDDLFQLMALRVLDKNGDAAVVFDSNHPVLVEMDFDLAQDNDQLCVGFDLTTNDGQSAFRTYQTDLEYADRPRLRTGRNRLRCVIPAGLLNAGSYMVNVRVSIHQQRWIAEVDGPVQFDVLLEHGSAEFVRNNLRPGPIALILPWSQV